MRRATRSLLILLLVLLVPVVSSGGVAKRRTIAAAVGGGGAGPFTFVESQTASDDTSGTTLTTTADALDLNVNDLLIVHAVYEDDSGNGTNVTAEVDTANEAFSFEAGDEVRSAGDEINSHLGYLVVANNDDAAEIVVTFSASRPYRKIVVMQYRPTSSGATLDISGTREATGSSVSGDVATGTFSTTSSAGLACATFGIYTSVTLTDWDLPAGSNASNHAEAGSATVWCTITTGALTTVVGDVSTLGGSTHWVTNAIAFK